MIRVLVLSAIAVLPSTAARAVMITWTVQDATTVDGGTLTGFFNFDPESGEFGDWRLSVSGGLEVFPSHTWDPTTSPTPQLLDFGYAELTVLFGYSRSTNSRQLRITPHETLSSDAGLLSFGRPGSVDCINCQPARIVEGYLIGEINVNSAHLSWAAVRSLYQAN